MKHSTIIPIATVAILAATLWTQPIRAQDPHHPEGGSAAPAAPSPTPPAMNRPQGMMGGMPMMNMPDMMQMMMGRGMGMGAGMGTIGRIEGRIAFLRAELKVTDAQANAWNAFADALRTNAQKLGAVRPAMMTPPGPAAQPSLADRLTTQERWLVARLEGTRAIKAAFGTLYGLLSDDQKKTADELLAPHMGLEMMPGMMGLGQMGMR